MRRQPRKSCSINAKLVPDDFAAVEKLADAQGLTPGAWVRSVVREKIVGTDPVLEAIAALRYVLFNALPWLAPVHLDSTEATRRPREVLEIEGLLRRLIEDAKQRKSKVDR